MKDWKPEMEAKQNRRKARIAYAVALLGLIGSMVGIVLVARGYILGGVPLLAGIAALIYTESNPDPRP